MSHKSPRVLITAYEIRDFSQHMQDIRTAVPTENRDTLVGALRILETIGERQG